jgi:hypothetical protein
MVSSEVLVISVPVLTFDREKFYNKELIALNHRIAEFDSETNRLFIEKKLDSNAFQQRTNQLSVISFEKEILLSRREIESLEYRISIENDPQAQSEFPKLLEEERAKLEQTEGIRNSIINKINENPSFNPVEEIRKMSSGSQPEIIIDQPSKPEEEQHKEPVDEIDDEANYRAEFENLTQIIENLNQEYTASALNSSTTKKELQSRMNDINELNHKREVLSIEHEINTLQKSYDNEQNVFLRALVENDLNTAKKGLARTEFE